MLCGRKQVVHIRIPWMFTKNAYTTGSIDYGLAFLMYALD